MALRDFILDRFWLKLFSFILATLIWFTVQSNVQMESRFAINPFRPTETREYTRTVRLTTLPANRRLYNIEPVEVRITVRGNVALLNQITQSDIQPYVNLFDVPDSAGSYPIEVKNVPRNLRVQVQQVVPSMVMVEPVRPK